MEINYNSVNARLYRWFYNVSDMPQSLCPYFWKLIWLYIAIVPVLVINLPIQIYDRFKFSKESNGERLRDGIIGYAIVLFSSAMLTTLYCVLFGFPKLEKDSLLANFIGLGIILWCFCIIFGIIRGIVKIVDYKTRKYYYEYENHGDYYGRKYYYDNNHVKIYVDEIQDTLIVAFIKAKYNRYCPKITWKKD